MRRREQGFTYVIVMFAVAVGSILALRAVETAMTDERRLRETDLLEVGTVFRDAIKDYYENSPGTFKQYPSRLEDMLDDVRMSTRRRQLRRIYRDPITGKPAWGLVMTEDGQHVKGVYSLSSKRPLKIGGFASDFAHFVGAKTYMDWQFTYIPTTELRH